MRVVEIASPGSAVRQDGRLLVVDGPERPPHRLPVADIDLLVIAVPHVAITGGALAALADAGIPLMICDTRHQPMGWLAPVGARPPVTPDRARAQAGLPTRTADRLWRDIVICKILRQADLLRERGHPDAPLPRYAQTVAPGDGDNREAAAAGHYWRVLLDGQGRRRDGGPVSCALDWGYAVLRAIVVRSLVACGLHPGIGLRHRGETDPFPLAADLMEPYRPAVDRLVLPLAARLDAMSAPEWKRVVAGVGETPIRLGTGIHSLSSAVMETARSYARVIDVGRGALTLPAHLGPHPHKKEGGGDARRLPDDVAPRLL